MIEVQIFWNKMFIFQDFPIYMPSLNREGVGVVDKIWLSYIRGQLISDFCWWKREWDFWSNNIWQMLNVNSSVISMFDGVAFKVHAHLTTEKVFCSFSKDQGPIQASWSQNVLRSLQSVKDAKTQPQRLIIGWRCDKVLQNTKRDGLWNRRI